jgi:hypothetical protein
VPKQTEVRQIESHDAAFAKDEARLIIMAIAYVSINDNLSRDAKFGLPLICGSFGSDCGKETDWLEHDPEKLALGL